MAKEKNVYVCEKCDYQSSKWYGKCPNCNSFNSFILETYTDDKSSSNQSPKKSLLTRDTLDNEPVKLKDISSEDVPRIKTNCAELDRVLGGGLVLGSVILLSGEPGIGKSTLLLQLCEYNSKDNKVLYVSGEESASQISMRAKRLGVNNGNIYLLTDTNAVSIIEKSKKLEPKIIVIDSIQTMYHSESQTIPGSITQIRECASLFINYAKTNDVIVIMVGHVTKDGNIAGPKVLEHMVDTVLYFEGDQKQNCRLLRTMKNRYGSTNELGVFQMTGTGLEEVENPSELLLSDRPKNVSGNCGVCVIEGSRPLVAEIQALITPTVYANPKRTSSGIDYNRVSLVLAVLEKRLGLKFSLNDAYINVIGGIRIEESSSDVGMALAMISSIRDIPIKDDIVCIGELGLSGEVRAVQRIEDRIKEVVKLGFKTIILPKRNAKNLRNIPKECTIVPISNVYEIISILSKLQ